MAELMDYDFEPCYVYYGKSIRRFGVELEVKGHLSTMDGFEEVIGTDEDQIYYKYDSSIGGGYEIVTHPHSLNSLLKLPWEEGLKYLSKEGMTSHNSGTCGLHVHISRYAFEGEKAIAKLILLIENHWEKWLKFSRRTEAQIREWARRYDTKCYEKCLNLVRYPEGRYHAVNLDPINTVELRFFRGTLKYNTFVATLKVVDRLVDLVNELTLEQIMDLKFEEIVQFGDENVNQYLQEIDLYVDEEIEDPMTWEVDEEEEENKKEVASDQNHVALKMVSLAEVWEGTLVLLPNKEMYTVRDLHGYTLTHGWLSTTIFDCINFYYSESFANKAGEWFDFDDFIFVEKEDVVTEDSLVKCPDNSVRTIGEINKLTKKACKTANFTKLQDSLGSSVFDAYYSLNGETLDYGNIDFSLLQGREVC